MTARLFLFIVVFFTPFTKGGLRGIIQSVILREPEATEESRRYFCPEILHFVQNDP